jgi:hypothetical protein
VQTQPVAVPGVAGPVVVDVNWFTGKHSVTVGGRPVPGSRRTGFQLPAAGGGTVPARVRGGVFDPYPTVEIAGVKHRTGPPVPVWLQVLALVPLSLIAVGAALGAVIGVLGMSANLAVLRGSASTAVKVLMMLGVLVVATLVWLVAAVAIRSAIGS